MLLTLERTQTIRRLCGVSVSVFLGNEDVTDACFVADDAYGYVGVYRTPRRVAKGEHRTALVARLLTGDVFYVWRSPDGHMWSGEFVKASA